MPTKAPAQDSTRLSVTSSRTMRARFAPSASRSETSFARAIPRASSMPPMFVHAINRISATSVKSNAMNSAAGVRPGVGIGREGSTPILLPRLASGYSRSRSRAIGRTFTGLGQCHPALEPSVGHHPYRRARREHGGRIPRYIVRIDTGSAERRIRRDRYPEIGDRQVRSSESRRGDTEDRKSLAVEPHLAADDVAFAVKRPSHSR